MALKYLKRKGLPHGKLTSKMIIFKDGKYKISPAGSIINNMYKKVN